VYLRESKQKRADGSVVTYLQLAENVWNAEKRRSETRILCNCGRADDEAVSERLRRLAKSILRRCSPEEIVAGDENWRLVCAWPYGDVYVLQALWEGLGIDQVLNEQVAKRRLGFDVERALFAMVANRALAPCSKLYCYEQWLREDVKIAGTQALSLPQLYRAMDFLEANKEAIERSIFFRVAADRRRPGGHARGLPGAPLGVPGQYRRRHHDQTSQSRPARLATHALPVRGRCGDGLRVQPRGALARRGQVSAVHANAPWR
jgi:hypothetical protein